MPTTPQHLGEFPAGSLVYLECRFGIGPDPTLAPADPTTVEVAVTRPGGGVTIQTWALGGVVRLGVGHFRYTLDVDTPGTWSVAWRAAGAVQAAVHDELIALRP